MLRALQVSELDPYLGMLAGQPDSEGLRALFTTWLTLPESLLRQLVPAVLAGAVTVDGDADAVSVQLPADAALLEAIIACR